MANTDKKKLSGFEEAFKKAKADGKKKFTYKGKKYHTHTKEEGQNQRGAPFRQLVADHWSDKYTKVKKKVKKKLGFKTGGFLEPPVEQI
tara:strand:+ start:651 stop:917 length:267 start_codon:yes stop_codon:yes gene_type:complete